MEELNIAQTEKETQYPQLPPFNNSSALSLQLGASGPANVDGDADGSKSSSTDPDQHVQNAHALDDQNIDQGGNASSIADSDTISRFYPPPPNNNINMEK